MSVTIHPEQPDTKDALMLIHELDVMLSPMYPEKSRHGYSTSKLIEQKVEFFVIRHDGEPAGCAGLQFLDNKSGQGYGEIKRMYVRPPFRGLGLARLLLKELEEIAAARGVEILRLETGIYQAEAIRLYERYGFKQIGPFGEYRDDPLSRYYEQRLSVATHTKETVRE
jgi:ribosomal protein S18 acetylase RimI-like enzyme